MGRYDDNSATLPPRIKAAMDFLWHTRQITEQTDASIPVRSLTPLEKSVETAALRAIQQYLLGEMDFVEETTPEPPEKKGDDDNSAGEPVPSTK
jgi:hypothetical protein